MVRRHLSGKNRATIDRAPSSFLAARKIPSSSPAPPALYLPTTMLPKVGRNLYAAALLAFAIQHVLYAVTGGGIGPPWIVGHTAWAWIMGAVLLVTSFSIATGKQAGVIAAGFTVVLLFCVEIIYGRRLAANIHNPGPWTSSAELICVAGAAFVIAGMHLTGKFSARAKLVGRILFALPLIVFAVQHFLYAGFIATLIPVWIPARLFWAYFVGIAFLAASASIATRFKGWLGATLLGAMFLIWVLIVHAPRVVAASHNANEWTSLFVALTMCGGAWSISETLRGRIMG